VQNQKRKENHLLAHKERKKGGKIRGSSKRKFLTPGSRKKLSKHFLKQQRMKGKEMPEGFLPKKKEG